MTGRDEDVESKDLTLYLEICEDLTLTLDERIKVIKFPYSECKFIYLTVAIMDCLYNYSKIIVVSQDEDDIKILSALLLKRGITLNITSSIDGISEFEGSVNM